MSTRLKICGITTLEDARFCAAAGVDFLGYVMDTSSPRYVEPSVVRDINEWVVGPLSVGVFVDADVEAINQIASATGIDIVQLHGSETPEDCRRVEHPVIKAITVEPESTPDSLASSIRLFDDAADYLLFDTKTIDRADDSRTPFDWNLLSELTSARQIFLAGGITAANVALAIERARPYAVDVSSGVEESPGKKDFEQITQLVEVVRSA